MTPLRRGGPRLLATGALLLATSALLLAAQARSADSKAPAAAAPAPTERVAPERRIIAFYFHTEYRCPSCLKIETLSHQAIETAFAADLAAGRIVWQPVDIEKAGNEHFAKDYQLFTKSLVLVEETAGKPGRWKNLAKVWELLQDEDAFLRYVQGEVRAFRAERP